MQRFKFQKRDLTTKKKLCQKKSQCMKKCLVWQKSLELKRLMVEKQLQRLQKRLMIIKHGQLSYLARCLQQYLNFQCSNQKYLNCNRKRKKRIRFQNNVYKISIKDFLRLQMQTWNGKEFNATNREEDRRAKNECNVKHQNSNFNLMA